MKFIAIKIFLYSTTLKILDFSCLVKRNLNYLYNILNIFFFKFLDTASHCPRHIQLHNFYQCITTYKKQKYRLVYGY